MSSGRRAEGCIPEPVLEAVWDLWSAIGRRPRLRMAGSSMRPLIAEGDELLVEPRPARVRLGDVAIYRRDRRWVAHRVVGRRSSENQELLLVKGDHVLDFDPPLAVGRVCGRVAAIVTPAGTSDYSYRTWRILNTLAALLSAAIGRTCSLYRALRQMPSRTTAPPTALVALVKEE